MRRRALSPGALGRDGVAVTSSPESVSYG